MSLNLWFVMVLISMGGSGAQAPSPHIIFIMADDMGWNDVSFHGYNEIPTPNIDRLARDGVILNSYYTQYMCTPSRTALMTGKYPMRFALQHFVLKVGEDHGLDATAKIMPQYLKEAGYKTHIIGKWHLGYYRKKITPTMRGFDTFLGCYNGMNDYYTYIPTDGLPLDYIGLDLWDEAGNITNPGWKYVGQYSTELFTGRAVNIINNHNASIPLFLYLPYQAPHYANADDPVQAPKKYVDRFPHIALEGRRKYAATVSALDDAVGDVMSALEAKGMAGNSVVVFSSDNGGAGPEQGTFFGSSYTFANNWPLKGSKSSLWEGGLRATACIWSPLLEKPNRVSNELYHISDWLPTFTRLAGLNITDAESIDGFDIWESISKDLPSPRTEIMHQTDSFAGEYAIRWQQYKLVVGSAAGLNGYHLDQWYLPDGQLPIQTEYIIDTPGALKCEDIQTAPKIPCRADLAPCLFDIHDDPCEYRNIAQANPDIVKLLFDKIVAFNRTALQYVDLPFDPRAMTGLHGGTMAPWEA